jgi:hypothetical protein
MKYRILIKWINSETDDYHEFENTGDKGITADVIRYILNSPLNDKLEEVVIMFEKEEERK